MSTTTTRKGIGGHHRGFRGASDVWLTPPKILKALGPFDLDPCAPDPRPWDMASLHYSEGGLNRPWVGRVWLNPPYGPETGKWLAKLAEHGDGIGIIFARTETQMFFAHVWEKADAVLFIRGRLHFHRADGARAEANAGGPSCLVAYGRRNVDALMASGIAGRMVLLSPSPAAAGEGG
jgi:hypothetical protein